jgi:hypothetical protein
MEWERVSEVSGKAVFDWFAQTCAAKAVMFGGVSERGQELDARYVTGCPQLAIAALEPRGRTASVIQERAAD